MKYSTQHPAENIEAAKMAASVDPIQVKKTMQQPRKPGTPSWGPVIGVVYSLGLAFIGGSTIAAVGVSLVLAVFGMSEQSIGEWYTSSLGACVYSLVTAAITLGIIAVYVMRSRSGWRSLGIIPPRWKHLGVAVAAVFAYLALYILIISIVKTLLPAINLEQQQDLGISDPSGLRDMILIFVTLVVLPPIVEEIIFRGFMFGGLRTKLPFVVSALITSVLFALGHLQFGSSAPLLWVAAIDTFVLSMVMCYVRERTGSIIPTMIMHALKNLLAFSFLYIFVS